MSWIIVLTSCDQRVWTVQGRYMGMFKLHQGCKGKPCGSPGPAAELPSTPHHDRESNMFRHRRGFAFFFFFAFTFQFFTDTHTASEDLCHREIIKIQSSVKVWGTIFLFKTLIVLFPEFSLASTELYRQWKNGVSSPFLLKLIWKHYFFLNPLKPRTARSKESTG